MTFSDEFVAVPPNPFYAISNSKETCLSVACDGCPNQCPDECLGAFTPAYLIGNSVESGFASTDKYIGLKLFEVHLTASDTLTMCTTLSATATATATVTVQIKQDIGPPSSNACHPNNGPSDECKFSKISNNPDNDGYVNFGSPLSGQQQNFYYYRVESANAIPNLVRKDVVIFVVVGYVRKEGTNDEKAFCCFRYGRSQKYDRQAGS